jgi:hypothetical protein
VNVGSHRVEFSRRHKFSGWPNAEIPAVAGGVYAVWDGSTLIYCGSDSGVGRPATPDRPRSYFPGRGGLLLVEPNGTAGMLGCLDCFGFFFSLLLRS